MSSDQEIQAFDALLKAFDQVPKRPERLPTFLEITRYPHYENVCSNILAFYLDPGKPHGLGTLFLDALGRVGEIKDPEGTLGISVEVETQEETAKGNRIDILIRSDSHAVLIENKIFHTVANPLSDYAQHLDSTCSRQSHKHKFLLTLYPIDKRTKRDVKSHGFRHITHKELVRKIRELLGAHVAEADTRYLIFMLDFLNTLENLREDLVVNEAFIDFLEERTCDARRFLRHMHQFKNDLRRKIRDLEQKCPVESYPNVRATPYPGEEPKVDLYSVLAHDIGHPSLYNSVVVETVIHPGGWNVQIWLRNVQRGGEPNRGPVDGQQKELRNLLNREGITLEDDTGVGYGRGTRFIFARFDYFADIDEVALAVRDVVKKLATSEGSEA